MVPWLGQPFHRRKSRSFLTIDADHVSSRTFEAKKRIKVGTLQEVDGQPADQPGRNSDPRDKMKGKNSFFFFPIHHFSHITPLSLFLFSLRSLLNSLQFFIIFFVIFKNIRKTESPFVRNNIY